MPELDRRTLLAAMLAGIAVVGSASTSVAATTIAAPPPGLIPRTGLQPLHKVQVVVGPRRRRRWRCWWRRHRRVCGWRW
ncbi:MAG TPA: hypothetical protein VFR00_04740 [Hyphomicrobiaceae bacterium]|jgi:hypothetical protein|nr:hypothetical protein [Hyphomicrobiaceae bacterium]